MEIGKNINTITDHTIKTFIKYRIPVSKILAQKHPHIVNNVAMFWGSKEFVEYMEKLILNEQSQDRLHRQGFSPEVFVEIINLINYHNAKYPSLAKKNDMDAYGF